MNKEKSSKMTEFVDPSFTRWVNKEGIAVIEEVFKTISKKPLEVFSYDFTTEQDLDNIKAMEVFIEDYELGDYVQEDDGTYVILTHPGYDFLVQAHSSGNGDFFSHNVTLYKALDGDDYLMVARAALAGRTRNRRRRVMSDRTEQAGAHAEARTQTWTDPHSEYADGYVSGHMAGVEWADANHPAVEALARVRGLHRPVESQWGGQACAECSNGRDLEVTWPCDTATEVEV